MRTRNLALAAVVNAALVLNKGTELSWVKAHLTKAGRLDGLIAIKRLEDRTDATVLKKAAEKVVYGTFDQWYGQLITNIVTCRQDTAPKKSVEEAAEKKAA